MLLKSVVREYPVQVQLIVVVWKVSVDFPQQRVCKVRGKVLEVRVLLWGEAGPPPTWIASTGAPLGYLYLCLLPRHCRPPPWPTYLPHSLWPCGAPGFVPSFCGGGGVCSLSPCLPPSLLRHYHHRSCPLSHFPCPLRCVGPVLWVPGIGH